MGILQQSSNFLLNRQIYLSLNYTHMKILLNDSYTII